MINIQEEQFLVQNDKDYGTFVVTVREWYLFKKWCFKRYESRCYNQRIISEFIPIKEPKSPSKIGFVTSKQTKKRKKNENKSKTDKS